ncbi:Z protein [Mammarenavirus lassaense]|uniref:RING finger protein Z n=1 Tax=Mammarenavirus lassaense TaxID=3052310 RepID=A0A142I7X7_LASV|nr:Z protein [Mammarenavirus lassaense]AVN98157.1 Z protein [Mammarenavirus lassaense]AVN98159.1 Z protein [Mammarenavirus lassaense]SCA79103.1 Z protein [Mammarenavirus lassaense]
MGARQTKQPQIEGSPRASLVPDASHLGPQFCKSCWFENKGLVECNNHYLCLNCLSLLLSVSNRCPICKMPLPTKLRVSSAPSAPPAATAQPGTPPPYSP